jgi:hypothetical protein
VRSLDELDWGWSCKVLGTGSRLAEASRDVRLFLLLLAGDVVAIKVLTAGRLVWWLDVMFAME